MKRTRRFKVLWTAWMAGGGVVVAVTVYVVTASIGWTIAGLLLSGVVLNAIGQAVTRPVEAIRGANREVPESELHR